MLRKKRVMYEDKTNSTLCPLERRSVRGSTNEISV